MHKTIEDRAAALADQIDTYRNAANGQVLVAIDGRSGVGKSTFARLLNRRLNAALVSGDDFYAGGVEVRSCAAEKLADVCIDRARLRSVLQTLKSNRPARYEPFDWEAFDGSLAAQATIIYPRPVLILEGVYSNHPDLRTLVDFSVLLKVTESERVRRLRAREGAITDWEQQWRRAEDWYFKNLARTEDFDIVISNG